MLVHIHLLDVEGAGLDLVVHILVAGVEAAGVAAHGHQAAGMGHAHNLFAFGQHVAQRNFHLHVFARLQAGQGLAGMHLRGGAQNDSIDLGQGQAVGQIGSDVLDAVFISHLAGFVQVAADEGHHLHAVDVFDAVQVFDAEGTRTRQGDFDGFAHGELSLMDADHTSSAGVFKNGMAHSGVARGYMIKTVLDAYLL
jgi:hypothetical protein